ncbi:MAG: TonB-dependent receptor [Bacteroidales bacterium]|nr:TonB-dependent receptor [Bacteroidales bacterium]
MKQKTLSMEFLRLMVIGCLFFLLDVGLFAQSSQLLRGKVLDASTREPLIGVSVLEKGTSNGVVSDVDGNFMMQGVKSGATIVFSYVGYATQEILAAQVGNTVLLEEDDKTLNEVVVIGYGVQKKVNLSGAVSAVDGEKLSAKPASDVLSAMQGEMPGVAVLRSSGEPGSETSGMRIRGFSSVNATSALVLIDGIEGDISLLNADDIESISVLKDASACAIYGARAASGVVLVTTKSGSEGRPKISYNGYYAVNMPGNMPERLPAWEEQQWINIGRYNAGGSYEWNKEKTTWVANPNFNYYPNNNNGRWEQFTATNWVDEGTKDWAGQTNHSISVSGGSKNINYLISGNYYFKDGMLKYAKNNNTRVNLHAKMHAELNKYLSLGINVQYQSKKNNAPSNGAGSILNTMYGARARQLLWQPEETPNYDAQPYSGDLQVNPIDILKNGGTNESLYEAFLGKGELTIKNFVKGLSVNLSASRRAGYYTQRSERHWLAWYAMNGTTIRQQTNNPNSLYRQKNNDYHDQFEATVNYVADFGQHNVQVLAGSSYENYRKDQFDATARNMNSNDFYSFNYYDASEASNTTLGDLIQPWSMMSYFGRINYNFAERYLLEANIRYDGSSRLAPEKRWKAFPSVSAAWRVNQETWFKLDFVSNLKLRASWGQLGNGAVLGLYDYIPTISQSTTYITEKSYYQSQLASKDKTWETIETTNLGIDLGMFASRLNASFDYYWKYNNDMLSNLQLPHTIGIGVPAVNIGKLKTWGWEFEIKWNDRIGDFSYQVAFNLSDSKNELVEYDGADVITAGTRQLIEGYPLNTIWGYTTDGYWSSKEEYEQYKEAHPGYKSFSDGKVGAGDVKFLTLPDKDGSINHQVGAGDGTKENHGDLVYLGDTNGRYLYGLNLSAKWKGFDFAVMFQGVAKRKLLIDTEAIAPFGRTHQMPWTIHRDYWTEDNQDAYWPRLYNYNGDMFNFQPSDKWVQHAAYLRLKNITLGYTIPIPKRYIEKLRFYVTGNDIWEKTDILKVFDPEASNNVGRNYYPFFRTWSFGVNVTL